MDQGKGAKKRMKQDIHPNYQPVVSMNFLIKRLENQQEMKEPSL